MILLLFVIILRF